MKLIFIFAIWLFVVYGAEGCLLMDMAARTLGNMLAPRRANPNVIVINTRRREPQPRPAVVHTLYRPPRTDYGIGGGIAVARPQKSPKVDILGALGKLLSPPKAVARPTESPKIDILGALGKLLSPPKTNDYGRGEVSGRIPRPRGPKPTFDDRLGPPRMNYYGREKKPGGIVLSGITNNQNIKVQRPKDDDLSSEESND